MNLGLSSSKTSIIRKQRSSLFRHCLAIGQSLLSGLVTWTLCTGQLTTWQLASSKEAIEGIRGGA
jgi:hypothetical protein